MSKKKEGGKKVSLFPFGTTEMVKHAKAAYSGAKELGKTIIGADNRSRGITPVQPADVKGRKKAMSEWKKREKDAYKACVKKGGGTLEAKTKCAKKKPMKRPSDYKIGEGVNE